MTDHDYGPIQDDGEFDELAVLLNKAFGKAGDVDMSRDWAREHGPDAIRQVRLDGGRDGALGACLLRLPMGHFFGGRSVSTLGIAGVAVAPELRGQGLARRMMVAALREARAEGFALSSLYASTFRLYRLLGYERAGHRSTVEVDPRNVSVRESGARMRPMTEDDEPIVRRLYEDFARLGSGMLDRSEDIWRRVRNPARKESHAVLILEGEDVTGYARWIQIEAKGGGPFDLIVSDHVVATPVAARRLLAFITDHGTMAESAAWLTGPGEPLLALLNTTDHKLKHHADWLIRFLDVGRALEARGYNPGIEAELHLDLEDELFEENSGRFVLRVAGGRGTLERGGDGRLVCGVRGLAPLYTGHMSAAQLRLIGWLAADDETCAIAAAIFTGPVPWMPDFF